MKKVPKITFYHVVQKSYRKKMKKKEEAMQKHNNFLITSTLLTSENVYYDYDFISATMS